MAKALWVQPDTQAPTLTKEALDGNAEGFFFYDGKVEDGCRGWETPVDAVTGLPVPILPIKPFGRDASLWVDYHHHFHPRRTLIEGNDGDVAVRMSRGQDLPRWLHEHYHKFFAGPVLPTDRQQKFKTTVLACAGVIPDSVLDFSHETPVLRQTFPDEFLLLKETIRHEGERKELQKYRSNSYKRNRIGVFFANYAVEQQVEAVVSRKVIAEFLHTESEDKRITLGNLMLREAINLSIEPMKGLHSHLRAQDVPRCKPTDLRALVSDYFVRPRWNDYHEALQKRLLQVA